MRNARLSALLLLLLAMPCRAYYELHDDNSALRMTDRCGYAAIDYYQATPLLEALLPHARLRPVTVAVIDDGLDRSTGQFDDVQVRLLDPESLLADPEGHGSFVTSIIAADNDGAANNGIASRFLGERLSLLIGRAFDERGEVPAGEVQAMAPGDRSVAHVEATLARVRAAIRAGATIINLSFGSWDARDGRRPAGIQVMQHKWAEVIRDPANDHVLFIAAAANHPFPLTGGNDIPAGIDADNLITVGGVNACDPMTAWERSSFGSQIDLAAPVQQFATVRAPGGGGAELRGFTGNSYATPVVTSIAALVQSITGLQGAGLKAFLTDPANVLPTSADIGGKRPTLLKTVAAALLRELPSHPDITRVMDSMGGRDGVPDPVGYMVNRLHGGMSISFTPRTGGYAVAPSSAVLRGGDIVFGGSWPANPTGGDTRNLAIMMGGGVTLGIQVGANRITVVLPAPLRIGRRYSVEADAVGVLSQLNVAGTRSFIGAGAAGSLVFDECEMTRRSLPLGWFADPQAAGTTDRFVFLTLTGTFDGTVEGMVDTSPPESAAYQITAGFNVPLLVINVSDATKTHFEQHCTGGFAH